MLSHGTADVILEACTDFWDGADIYPLSGSDRWVRGQSIGLRRSAFLLTVLGCPRTTRLTSTLLPWQKESAGFLPARLPVWLLLRFRLQAHELQPVLPAQWQVHRAGAGAGPEQHLHPVRAAQHHPHQAEHPPQQLELRWYCVRPSCGGQRGKGFPRAEGTAGTALDLEHPGGQSLSGDVGESLCLLLYKLGASSVFLTGFL